jgi:PKD repeat protein
MLKYIDRLHNPKIGKVIFVLSLLLISLTTVLGQGIIDENKIYLIGQITNVHNGAPIENQEINVAADPNYNPNFIYSKKLITDKDGFYYDTIQTFFEKGALIISTEDETGIKYDTTLHFRFHWSESNVLFGNFIINLQIPANSFQANFDYIVDPNGDNVFEYAFDDRSIGSYISDWFWDFGDGTYSIEENPVHIYNESGVMRVELTTKRLIPGSLVEETSTITKIIHVRNKGYHSFGGQIFSEYFPIDMGQAYLYEIVNDKLIPIDTMVFDTAYWFYQILDGEYIVKADLHPESIYLDQFMATYYGDVLQWQEADTIFHDSNDFNYDIHLMPVGEQYIGPGNVAGSIIYDPTGKDGGGPACDMELLLYNSYDEPVICCHSNEDGEFDFSQVVMGTYKIHVEVTGKQTYPLQITINQNNLSLDGIQFIINSSSVNGWINSINERVFDASIGEVYPNPAQSFAFIDLNFPEQTDLEIKIYSISGKLIRNIESMEYQSAYKLQLEVADLPSGMYYLAFSSGELQITRKFIR